MKKINQAKLAQIPNGPLIACNIHTRSIKKLWIRRHEMTPQEYKKKADLLNSLLIQCGEALLQESKHKRDVAELVTKSKALAKDLCNI